MKTRTWKYHRSHSFKHEGKQFNVNTQLYQASGVYVAINDGNRTISQSAMSPGQMVREEQRLIADAAKGTITDLKWGSEIVVTKDENGYYKDVTNYNNG